jgi:hypothetical protein
LIVLFRLAGIHDVLRPTADDHTPAGSLHHRPSDLL